MHVPPVRRRSDQMNVATHTKTRRESWLHE